VGRSPLQRGGGGSRTRKRKGGGAAPFQLRVNDGDEFVPPLVRLQRELEAIVRVCRVEFSGKGVGTGFLVGPDVVLTNYHVIEPILKKQVSPGAVGLRFDHVMHPDSSIPPGTVYGLADDWQILVSSYSVLDLQVKPKTDPTPQELDFAFLRVRGRPGEELVTVPLTNNRVIRGWVRYAEPPHNFEASRALSILQHPDGGPLQYGGNTDAFLGANPAGTRIRYSTITSNGSSGSPIFNLHWRCVGLHHSGDPLYYDLGLKPRYNQGIPVARIIEQLQSLGQTELFQRLSALEAPNPGRVGLTDEQRLALQVDILSLYAADAGTGAALGSRLAGLLSSHGLDLARYRSPSGAAKDVAMALISEAEQKGWVEQLAEVVKAELDLLPGRTATFEAPAEPPSKEAAVGQPPLPPLRRVLLRGEQMMIGRAGLREKLAGLLDELPTSPKILVVRDAPAVAKGVPTGKSHTIQLISALPSDMDVTSAFVDLEELSPAANPRELGELIAVSLGFPGVLAGVERAVSADIASGAGDEQWARWSLRFCQGLKNAMDGQPGAAKAWLIIDSFNQVALSPATLGLVRAIAWKLDQGWSRLRLLLLGYAGPRADLPSAVTVEEELTGKVAPNEIGAFFRDAYLQLGVPVSREELTGAIRRLLAAVPLTHPDFLKLAPPLIRKELAQKPSV
jgi:hypothetical protein